MGTVPSNDFVLRAPFPVTNVSPEADPMPPVADLGERSPDPDWRPSQLADVYKASSIRKIMAWFGEMRRYAVRGGGEGESGLRAQAAGRPRLGSF